MDHIPESLVTYDNPVLVTKNIEKISPKTMPLSTATLDPVLPPPKAKSSTTEASNQQIVEILDAILTPREWTENNQLFLQHLSIKPSTRKDVSQLQEKLDLQLKQRQAREKGMCSVRRELYTQCFDELIRQVTINCAERGVMLLRVRDEINMTLAAYQTLYANSVASGIRKALEAKQGVSDMEKKIADLENEKRDLERQVNELQSKYNAMERQENERQQMIQNKYAEAIQFLSQTNEQLKAQVDAIIVPSK